MRTLSGLPIGAIAFAIAAFHSFSPLVAGQSCQPHWVQEFGAAGPSGTDGSVDSFVVHDDGSGPALYVGGAFASAGGVAASNVAKWNGIGWSSVGTGTDGTVRSLATFDDGTGPALYAGGDFGIAGGAPAPRIAKWNGTSWSALPAGIWDAVYALIVFDDGTGPALYAGCDVNFGGGGVVAKWKGGVWSYLGGMDDTVFALAVYDSGGGPRLYAGGRFQDAGDGVASGIARWNGAGWSGLGSGVEEPVGPLWPQVNSLVTFNDGSGTKLYVGGVFATAGGVTANNVARWNGTSWSALGSGVGGPSTPSVLALRAFDDGGGPALYAGGAFSTAGFAAATNVAKWKGSSWSNVGNGANAPVHALTVASVGGGPALYAGGDFTQTGSVAANHVGRWKGSSWSSVTTNAPNDYVLASAVFDDGSGPALYVGGAFTSVAGIPTHVAKWSGSAWSALPGLSDYVNALAVFDGGSGPRLYAGTNEGLAWWNGSSWVSIFSDGPVFSLLTFDDGSGPALFVGGYGIGKFDGQWWYPLGSGVDGVIDPFDFYLPSVSAMTAFDDGSGPALYVGGYFMTAGGVATRCIAKWNGVSWSGLAGGLDVPSDGLPWVYALRAFDDGSGPALYVGGSIAGAGGVSAYGLMRWKGSTWSAMPAGGLDTNAMAFAAFDDGSGPALFVGGLFATAGGAPAHSMAKWNGTSWSALGSGMSGGTLYPGHAWVFTLSVFDDGSGPALYAGGDFTTSPAGDANLAKWAGCPPSALPGLVAYGTGTPGCQGTQTCGGNSSPHVGNSAFQITCDKTPPSSVGLGLVASAPDVAGHDLFGVGVAIHLDLALSPQVFTLDFLSDAAGHGAAAAPLPNNPGIVGAKLDAQAIWYWAGACSLPSAYSLSSSKGLEITFLP